MKKIISIFSIIALVLSTMLLSACGSKQASGNEVGSSVTSETTAPKSDGYEIAIVTDVGSLEYQGITIMF